MLALEVAGLKACIGNHVILDQVSFRVQEGELAALIGANGAGKTTLLKVLTGIMKPVEGMVKVFGEPLTKENRKLLSYLPQKSHFDPHFPLRVFDAVQLGRTAWSLFRRPRREDMERVEWCLAQVGLLDLAHRPIGELSGGQQQLVFLARALFGRPRLLLLDEPTTGLDVTARQRFYRLLKDLKHQLGLTVLIVTHDLEAVVAHADRVILLENQKVAYEGSPNAAVKTQAFLRVVD
ncbi:MAG TPA: metal ABC transporter ATP-binding protein [Clostridia bacterium]|nr:metal ABC transporter ATP-binding protein [Clostridia bacterium]